VEEVANPIISKLYGGQEGAAPGGGEGAEGGPEGGEGKEEARPDDEL
jgi:hypothetical protein